MSSRTTLNVALRIRLATLAAISVFAITVPLACRPATRSRRPPEDDGLAGTEGDGLVEVHGAAIYRLHTGERCHVLLHETAHFRDDRICRLVDELTPGAVHEMSLCLTRYADLFPASLQGPEHL